MAYYRVREGINPTKITTDIYCEGEEAKKKRRYALALREVLAQKTNNIQRKDILKMSTLEHCYTPYEWKVRNNPELRRKPKKCASVTVNVSLNGAGNI